MKSYLNVTALVFVVATLLLAALIYVLALGSHHVVGVLLLACGAVSAIAAPQVVEGHRLLHERFSLARPLGPRSLTVVLWGCGIAILGIFMLFGV